MKTINNTADQYMSLPYTIIMHRDEDGDMVASIKELSGCMAHGQDANEALEILAEFQRAWIERRIESGNDVPLPEKDEELPSGKWVQRVPRSLHLQLTKQAEAEGVSLNQLVTSLLAQQVTSRAVVKAVENLTQRGTNLAQAHAWEHFVGIAGEAYCKAPNTINGKALIAMRNVPQLVNIQESEIGYVGDPKDERYYSGR
jgi:antitoxin HicB